MINVKCLDVQTRRGPKGQLSLITAVDSMLCKMPPTEKVATTGTLLYSGASYNGPSHQRTTSV